MPVNRIRYLAEEAKRYRRNRQRKKEAETLVRLRDAMTAMLRKELGRK